MRTLAVVVLNWNGLGDTRALLPTLERCRLPEGWQARVLVVDNGSSDGSVAAIRREFPAVEVLALPENRRFAGGNNEGLKHVLAAGADAMMLLNNDTEADPGLYDRLLLALEQDPTAGAAAPLIYFAAPSRSIWYGGGTLVPALGFAAHRGLRKKDEGQYRSVESTGYLT
ncbi:MAG TPA: glycosyltransferase, partial [Candidatus Limnocylindria bacterium]|nr:glycosyltransferase [Candidatus Limnocylindria bacterium]